MAKSNPTFILALALSLLPACGSGVALSDADDIDVDGDGKADGTGNGWSTSLNDDNLNGLWTATLAGKKLADPAVIESWSSIGVRVHVGDKVYPATLAGTKLTGTSLAFDLKANAPGVSDDS